MKLALVLVALLAGCAHARAPRDSAQWRACKMACAIDGATGRRVVENDEDYSCECAKPAEPET